MRRIAVTLALLITGISFTAAAHARPPTKHRLRAHASSTQPDQRSFQTFSQAADEGSASRIYAGQHFRYDEDAGQALGDEVGDFVLDSILGPSAHGHGYRDAA